MALDDGFRENRRNREHSRNPRGGGYGPGPDHYRLNHPPTRATPYPLPQGHARRKETGLVDHQSNAESGTKLYISNLDSDVSEKDIGILFSDVGPLESYLINYNSRGQPTGTAEVIFCHQADALAAIRRYKDVELDGRPMQIELAGGKLPASTRLQVPSAPLPPPRPPAYVIPPMPPAYYIPNHMQFFGANGSVVNGNANGWGHEVNRNAKGWGRGNARGKGLGRGNVYRKEATNPGRKPTAEELDADLDNYRLEALKSRQSP